MAPSATKEQDMINLTKDRLLSGQYFRFIAASYASQVGYQFPMERAVYSHIVERLSRMAAQTDAMARLAHGIIPHVPLYGSRSEIGSAVYFAAEKALGAGYVDTIGLAGPEPGRRSDRTRDYSLHERVALAHWLERACRPVANGAPGVGWTLSRLADQIGFHFYGN